LAVQAFIKAYSKSLHYDSEKPEAHLPVNGDDEVGKIWVIGVKVQICNLMIPMLYLLILLQEWSSSK
jgi:hypothetical protein